jgi:hypothetical protein
MENLPQLKKEKGNNPRQLFNISVYGELAHWIV